MIKKALVVVAIAALLSVGSTAQAATVAELQAMIAQLTAQISSLSGGSTAASTGYKFNTNLTVGSTGADVVALQDWLAAKGFLSIPAGTSKGYFGQLTKTAVAAYQASAGISATGFVGPATRGALNAAAPVVTTPGTVTPTTPGTLSGGEGQLTDIGNTSADVESTLSEGEEEVKVFGAEFDAEDSDIAIERVDVDFSFVDGQNGSDNLEDYITEVSLFWGDKKLATLDVDEADINDAASGDFTDTANGNDVYSFRFTGLNGVVKEGDTSELYVAVSAVNNIDSTDDSDTWAVLIPDDGIRAVDAAGISETYVSSSDLSQETFGVEAADAGDLDLSISGGENKDRVISTKADSEVKNIEILKFTLESDSSDNNVDEIEIDLATTTSTSTLLSTAISRLTLFADGKELATESVPSTNGGAAVLFENLDLDIKDGDEVEFVVKADFKKDADEREGYSFEATVDAEQIDAEDSEGDTVNVTGDVTGGEIELRTTGLAVKFVSADETVRTGSIATDPDIADFTIVFDVSAVGDEDIFIDGDVVAGTPVPTSSLDGIIWATTTDSTTGTTTTGSYAYGTATLSADGSTSDDVTTSGSREFKINNGATRRFTFKVSIPAGGDNVNAGTRITGIKWDTATGDSTAYLYEFNLDDLKTDTVTGLFIR
jgi:hypothetical protein